MRHLLTGVVLAGGMGRRMGGEDKGLLPFGGGGKTLIAQVLARLAPQVSQVVINANRNLAAYGAFGFPLAADIITDFSGPLAGIHAGMCAAQTPWVLTVPCDSPFFPPDLAQRLFTAAAAAETDGANAADGALAAAGGRAQPVFMLVRRALADDLAAALQQGERKIDRWTARYNFKSVHFEDAAAFENINTRAQLAAASGNGDSNADSDPAAPRPRGKID